MNNVIDKKLEKLKKSKEYIVGEAHSRGLTNEEISKETSFKLANIQRILAKYSLPSNLYKRVDETNELKQLILGSILGDGSLSKLDGTKKQSRLRVAHCLEQEEYCRWKASLLEKAGLLASVTYAHTFDERFKEPDYTVVKMSSFSHPVFTSYRDKFYLDNKRKYAVADELQDLDELGLAIWYMDDGSRTASSMTLSTHSFSEDEVRGLIKLMKVKFDLEFTMQKSRAMYLRAVSWEKFRVLVSPYIVNCMKYKIRPDGRVLYKEEELLES